MRPIFIGGADRSGTTLLGSLLQCIPESCTTPETRFKTEIPWHRFGDFKDYNRQLKQNHRFKVTGLRANSFDQDNFVNEADFLKAFVDRYAGRSVSYWVDHTPDNLMRFRHLMGLFPNALFVHMVRDGRAVANSILDLSWGENTMQAAAKSWVKKISYGFAAQAMFPDKVVTVRFEDVVNDPVAELQRILDFIGIQRTLESQDELIFSADFVPRAHREHAAVGQLPQREIASKWREKLSSEQIRDFEHYAGEMLTILGYDLLTPAGVKISTMHKLRQNTKELLYKKLINPRRWRRRNLQTEQAMMS